jgi:hypothetical protein
LATGFREGEEESGVPGVFLVGPQKSPLGGRCPNGRSWLKEKATDPFNATRKVRVYEAVITVSSLASNDLLKPKPRARKFIVLPYAGKVNEEMPSVRARKCRQWMAPSYCGAATMPQALA